MLRVILSTKAKKLESYGILQNGTILVQVLRHLTSVIMAGMPDSTFIGCHRSPHQRIIGGRGHNGRMPGCVIYMC